jgi:hypothetical protein
MKHRKNRDLKAELVEMQLAAQAWEDKYIASLRAAEELRSELNFRTAKETELRIELGQASREIAAVAASLEQCRRERGKALDKLADSQGLWRYWCNHDITENDDDWADFSNAVQDHLDGKRVDERWLTLTPPGDTSEFDKTFDELNAELVGVTEMHITSLECQKRTDARDAPVPQLVRNDGDWVEP